MKSRKEMEHHKMSKELVRMKKNLCIKNKRSINIFCRTGKKLIEKNKLEECQNLILETMKNNPDAPEPHNMLGIILEKKGNHPLAMRHFRAAWALDPSYLPARQNLEAFGTFDEIPEYHFGDQVEEIRENDQDIA